EEPHPCRGGLRGFPESRRIKGGYVLRFASVEHRLRQKPRRLRRFINHPLRGFGVSTINSVQIRPIQFTLRPGVLTKFTRVKRLDVEVQRCVAVVGHHSVRADLASGDVEQLWDQALAPCRGKVLKLDCNWRL